MAQATRIADPGRSSRTPTGSSARFVAATVDWVRTAVDCEPASVQVLLPESSGRLRSFATSGEPFVGGRLRSRRRRQAFETRRPIRIALPGPEERSLQLLPLIVDGVPVGVIEIVADTRVLEERRGILDAVVAQSAVVIRSVFDKRDVDDELHEQGSLLRLAGELLNADSESSAVRIAVAGCAERLSVPIAGMLPEPSGRGWFVAAARGLGSSKRAELGRWSAGVRSWGHPRSVPARLAARFEAITGVQGVRPLRAGDAVILVGASTGGEDFLRRVATMLRDSLDHIGTVGWAQLRNEDLDLAIATTAHELKEPLVGARAALDNVVVADEDPQGRELLRRTQGELGRLADLVDPLLRWSAGPGSLVMCKTDLVRIVGDAVASCSLRPGAERVILASPEQVWVWADPVELRGGIANVIRNALEYSPPESTVNVVIETSYDGARVSVRDRGPGVPAAERPLIFDPFARGKAGHAGRGGKGLGLFIARRVVEAHGGSLVMRPVRRGAEFCIELPLFEAGRSLSAS